MSLENTQRTEEWRIARKGRFTASSIKNLLMTPSTTGYQNEVKRVVFERFTGLNIESFESEWMTRGKELEAEAINMYQATTFNVVEACGFFPFGEWMGASPDGLIGDDGLLEVKCPKWNTMIDYLIDKKVPKDYNIQIQTQMICTGRTWCDFVAYHPGMELLIVRVEPDLELQKQLTDAVDEAVKKVILTLNKLKQ